eukprot:SAG31_NODE_4551_length_3145_cov_1.682534_3_plen_498_part_01
MYQVVARWAPSFAVFDRDGSGSITAQELQREYYICEMYIIASSESTLYLKCIQSPPGEFAEFGEQLGPAAAAQLVAPSAHGGKRVDVVRFAQLMEAPFKAEGWSMAQAVAAAKIGRPKLGSRVLQGNFLSKARMVLSESSVAATPEEEAAALKLQALSRGLATRKQTRQLKRAVSKMLLLGSLPSDAALLHRAFTSWMSVTKKTKERKRRYKLSRQQHSAATKLQAVARGRSARKLLNVGQRSAGAAEHTGRHRCKKRDPKEDAAARRIQAAVRGCNSRRKSHRIRHQRQVQRKIHNQRKSVGGFGSSARRRGISFVSKVDGTEQAAVRLQAAERGRQARSRRARHRRTVAATKLQANVRGRQVRQRRLRSQKVKKQKKEPTAMTDAVEEHGAIQLPQLKSLGLPLWELRKLDGLGADEIDRVRASLAEAMQQQEQPPALQPKAIRPSSASRRAARAQGVGVASRPASASSSRESSSRPSSAASQRSSASLGSSVSTS